jgi:choline dehydrogenase-like flavoprotein
MAKKDVVDILLIGSGAAGGPFAWSLSQLKGVSIMCLEQGDWDRPADEKYDWSRIELFNDGTWKRLIKPPKQEAANYFEHGYPYDHTDSSWEPILGHHVGGAMVHYSAVWARLRPADFLQKTLTGVGDDWPIRYEDLSPWYDFNDNFVGIAGMPGNPAYPGRKVDLQPLPGGQSNPRPKSLFEQAADKLGWHYFQGGADRAIISVPFKGRNPRNIREAKNRPDVVHWPEAIKNGVVLKTRATVREITVNRQGLADGAVYFDADGGLHEQKARIVVVACNGIGTPRLLLNSKSSRFPNGLANSSGLVGKGLMAHPSSSVVGEFENDEPSPSFGGGRGANIDEFADPKWRGDVVGGFTLNAGGFVGPTAVALGVLPETLTTIVPAHLEQGPRPTGNMTPWGRAHHAAFQQRFRRTASVGIGATDIADDFNRVELHPTLTDDFGTPAPKLFYHRSEAVEKLFTYGMERAKQLLETAGATRIVFAGARRDGVGKGAAPGHYMGTARMGSDPARSVVDKYGRAHDVRNLLVICGAVFTTAGTAGPTSTIQANALRIADYIKKNSKDLLT